MGVVPSPAPGVEAAGVADAAPPRSVIRLRPPVKSWRLTRNRAHPCLGLPDDWLISGLALVALGFAIMAAVGGWVGAHRRVAAPCLPVEARP
jgi:hypothetical protein